MASFPKDTQPFLLGALAGAVLISYAGFNHMGWTLGSTADALAKRQAENAVVAAHSQICSAQFRSAKTYPVQIAALEKTERYSRGELLVKGGWATMPGSKEPDAAVGQACAELLIPEKS